MNDRGDRTRSTQWMPPWTRERPGGTERWHGQRLAQARSSGLQRWCGWDHHRHPISARGRRHMNSSLWMRPAGDRSEESSFGASPWKRAFPITCGAGLAHTDPPDPWYDSVSVRTPAHRYCRFPPPFLHTVRHESTEYFLYSVLPVGTDGTVQDCTVCTVRCSTGTSYLPPSRMYRTYLTYVPYRYRTLAGKGVGGGWRDQPRSPPPIPLAAVGKHAVRTTVWEHLRTPCWKYSATVLRTVLYGYGTSIPVVLHCTALYFTVG